MLFFRKYENIKSDKWVVFIHGIGGSSTIFAKQIKALKKDNNLLLVDLRGHGKTGSIPGKEKYTFEVLANDILELLDFLKIKKAIFVGVSLGTIMINKILLLDPNRVEKAILAGAVTTYNKRIKFWMRIGLLIKNIIPYMWLYSFFAWVLMPKKKHKYSRVMFIREARQMNQREFLKWFDLVHLAEKVYKDKKEKGLKVPTLVLMGEDDYMFLETVKEDIEENKYNELKIIKNSGHICNVDNPEEFNRIVAGFIKGS